MSHILTAELISRHGPMRFNANATQFDHHGLVLRGVGQLENELSLLLYVYFRSVNPALSWNRAKRDLFTERGILDTLTKMNKLASYLGLLTDDTSFDLKQLMGLRNLYAHGRSRRQFPEDPDATAQLYKLRLYKNSKHLLVSMDAQQFFRSACTHFTNEFQARREAINPGSVATDHAA